MEWLGLIAFGIIMCFIEYPKKVKKLERKIKKIEKKQRGVNEMSKLISELVNKECKIYSENAISLVGTAEQTCFVLEADDEWIKIEFLDKKNNKTVKLVRIENIDTVEVIDNEIKQK